MRSEQTHNLKTFDLQGNWCQQNTGVLMSPRYDHGPVVHDWQRDDEQPVVIKIPRRINDKHFLGPMKRDN